MNLELDEDVIKTAVSQAAANAIQTGIADWQVRNQLEAEMKSLVGKLELVRIFRDAVEEALEENAEALIKDAILEAVPVIKEGFKQSVRASIMAMLYGLYAGYPSEKRYMAEEDKSALKRVKDIMEKLDDDSVL